MSLFVLFMTSGAEKLDDDAMAELLLERRGEIVNY